MSAVGSSRGTARLARLTVAGLKDGLLDVLCIGDELGGLVVVPRRDGDDARQVDLGERVGEIDRVGRGGLDGSHGEKDKKAEFCERGWEKSDGRAAFPFMGARGLKQDEGEKSCWAEGPLCLWPR